MDDLMMQIEKFDELCRSLTPAKAVAAGASVLDAKDPGWERRVNLSTLELRNSCRCVLGQLYGGYTQGVDRFCTPRISPGIWAVGYGFDVSTSGHPMGYGYDELDEAWISLIKERFNTGAFSDV